MSLRTRPEPISQSINESVKRAKRSKPALDQCQSTLFAYPFVLPMVLGYVYDTEVVSLVKTCKAMKPIMSQFVVYRIVTQAFADEIIDPSRLSCFQASIVISATHGDLRKHRQLTNLRFDDRFNSPLQPGCLGDRLKSLTFGEDFNQLIDGILPAGLEVLFLGNTFNQPITPVSLPSSIIYLSLSNSFNQPLLSGVLPPSLRTLVVGRKFNGPLLPGVLPPNLMYLIFLGDSHQPFLPGSLPASLERLDLGIFFDQPILPGVLPFGLTHLNFSYLFNHPIAANIIPNTVTHLQFGDCFNQVLLPGIIPSSVVQLQLGKNYEHPFEPNSLPNSIKHFIFCSNHTELLDVSVLPKSVEHMEVGHYEKYPTPDDQIDTEPLILLPSTIPSSVNQLTIHRKCEVDTVLPSTIAKLVFGPQFNEQIPVSFIPSSVTHLRFGNSFSQYLTSSMLPSSLKYLTVGERFQPRMLMSFPASLTHLCFDKPLTDNEFSYSVKQLPNWIIYMVANMSEHPSYGDCLSGLLPKAYLCRSSESGTVKLYVSLKPIDIENLDLTKLRFVIQHD